MSSSTDGKKPVHVVDSLYMLNLPPNQKSWTEMMDMTRSLAELANQHNIQIEMPTHDEVTMTGRAQDVERFKVSFEDWFRTKPYFGLVPRELSIYSSKPRDPTPKSLIDFDFSALECRILSCAGQLWMFVPDPFEDRGEGGVE